VLVPQKAEAKTVVDTKSGFSHTVTLYDDGTVEATGMDILGSCSVNGASNVAAIDAAGDYTLLLYDNGVVSAHGLIHGLPSRNGNFCEIMRVPDSNYNIVAISAQDSRGYAVLKADGNVEIYGAAMSEQCYPFIPHVLGADSNAHGRVGTCKRLSSKCENIEDVVAIRLCCCNSRSYSGCVFIEETGCCLLNADGTVEKVGTHTASCTPPPADSDLWGRRVELKSSKPGTNPAMALGLRQRWYSL
jgi:hypothetical protein